ncbi:hypothetical protein QTP88_028692 [Uroleucon formosanum]
MFANFPETIINHVSRTRKICERFFFITYFGNITTDMCIEYDTHKNIVENKKVLIYFRNAFATTAVQPLKPNILLRANCRFFKYLMPSYNTITSVFKRPNGTNFANNIPLNKMMSIANNNEPPFILGKHRQVCRTKNCNLLPSKKLAESILNVQIKSTQTTRSLPISDRVEQRAAGRAVREGRPNQFWTRVRLPAKHADLAHNRVKLVTQQRHGRRRLTRCVTLILSDQIDRGTKPESCSAYG